MAEGARGEAGLGAEEDMADAEAGMAEKAMKSGRR